MNQNLYSQNIHIEVPELCLIVLIGATGSGKTSFARRYFSDDEMISIDACRLMTGHGNNNTDPDTEALALLHNIVRKRLALGKLTVVDADNTEAEARARLVSIARDFYVSRRAIVFELPKWMLMERSKARFDQSIPKDVMGKQFDQLHFGNEVLQKQGFHKVHTLRQVEEIEQVIVKRLPMPSNLRHITGPLDIIGDVHGCLAELTDLLIRLGYESNKDSGFHHPQGRRVVFVGDLTDRGPDSVGVLRLVMMMVSSGNAFTVLGNHDDKLMRYLQGRAVKLAHGLAGTVQQLDNTNAAFRQQVSQFLEHTHHHLQFDGGQLLVAHAGLKAEFHGRHSGAVLSFALYGDTTGKKDADGLPVRRDWAAHYDGQALVVYGHTPVRQPQFINNTINIDTGCAFGGKLTALRYPERELVSVPALAEYASAKRWIEPVVEGDE
jgi:protein phosphatase